MYAHYAALGVISTPVLQALCADLRRKVSSPRARRVSVSAGLVLHPLDRGVDGAPEAGIGPRPRQAQRALQGRAAKLLGVSQPKVSALRHYKLAGFPVERLMTLLTALDRDVEIVIKRKPRSRRTARIRVVAA